MKHTPGPWAIHKPTKTDRRILNLHPDGSRIIADHSTGYSSHKGTIPYEERLQNAKLISAAPDLLEEHGDWSRLLGHIIIEALQGNYDCITEFMTEAPIKYIDGVPHLESQAIHKATE